MKIVHLYFHNKLSEQILIDNKYIVTGHYRVKLVGYRVELNLALFIKLIDPKAHLNGITY